MSPRRSASEALDTRRRIIGRAVDIASTQGLEGLTIGHLAEQLEMSKAGVVGHFGNKEQLQLATLQTAVDTFVREVWEPASTTPRGLPRLLAICDAWISYLAGDVFPGGCFLTSASCEFDGRPGPVRDAVADALERWRAALRSELVVAKRAGELLPGADPAQIAFTLGAIAMGANQAFQLHHDLGAAAHARAAMRTALGVDRPVVTRRSASARKRAKPARQAAG